MNQNQRKTGFSVGQIVFAVGIFMLVLVVLVSVSLLRKADSKANNPGSENAEESPVDTQESVEEASIQDEEQKQEADVEDASEDDEEDADQDVSDQDEEARDKQTTDAKKKSAEEPTRIGSGEEAGTKEAEKPKQNENPANQQPEQKTQEQQAQPTQPASAEQQPAPKVEQPSKVYTWQGDSSLDFTATIDNTGESFTLSNQAGKVVMVNFWATWCGPCNRELPAIQQLASDYADGSKVRIITIDVGEESDYVIDYMAYDGYSFPVYCDTGRNISSKYGVTGIPYTVIFGKDGKVYKSFKGASDAQTQYNKYKDAINNALAQ